MTTTTVSPEVFEREAKRRLIDTHELMLELGLRNRSSLCTRVKMGTLPEPLFTRQNALALWDRDTLNLPDRKETT